MRLSRSVIRILAENHHFNVTQLGKAERVKDIFLWWIDSDAGLPLAGDGLKGIKKIGLLLFFSQLNSLAISLSCESSIRLA